VCVCVCVCTLVHRTEIGEGRGWIRGGTKGETEVPSTLKEGGD
jgi:hypothetical protein